MQSETKIILSILSICGLFIAFLFFCMWADRSNEKAKRHPPTIIAPDGKEAFIVGGYENAAIACNRGYDIVLGPSGNLAWMLIRCR